MPSQASMGTDSCFILVDSDPDTPTSLIFYDGHSPELLNTPALMASELEPDGVHVRVISKATQTETESQQAHDDFVWASSCLATFHGRPFLRGDDIIPNSNPPAKEPDPIDPVPQPGTEVTDADIDVASETKVMDPTLDDADPELDSDPEGQS